MSKRGYLPEETIETDSVAPARAELRPSQGWRTLIAVLISAVLGSGLAGIAFLVMKSTGTTPHVTPSITFTPSPTPTPTIETPSAGPATLTTKPQQTDEPSSTEGSGADISSVDKANTRVWVLNASTRNGWAGQVAQSLANAGFPNPVAENSTPNGLTSSIILYRSKEFEAAAQEVSRVTGIYNVQNADDGYIMGDTDIEVYLIG